MTTPAEDRPRVSVVSITYNQEPYVREALDGFVAQRTDFPVEVVVADDASTDGTAEVLAAYAERHPDLFRVVLREHNVGVHANLREALQLARGDYVAVCEGDDFWTDPTKLARQAAYLDAHPEVSLVFHPVEVRWQGGTRPTEVSPEPGVGESLTLERLLARNSIQTNSVMYRRLPDYGVVPDRVMPLDWYLHILHAREGGIGFLPEVMSVYRRHEGGIWWGSAHNDDDFWVRQGPAQALLSERLLEMFADEPERAEIVAARARAVVGHLVRASADPSAQLDGFAAEAPRSTLLALRALTEQAQAQADLVERLRAQVEKVEGWLRSSQQRVDQQAERIERLRRRVKRREAEVEQLRARLPVARVRSAARGVAERLRPR